MTEKKSVDRQLRALKQLIPWNWDARVEVHPPGEKAMHDFENVLNHSLESGRRRSGRGTPTSSARTASTRATGTPSYAASRRLSTAQSAGPGVRGGERRSPEPADLGVPPAAPLARAQSPFAALPVSAPSTAFGDEFSAPTLSGDGSFPQPAASTAGDASASASRSRLSPDDAARDALRRPSAALSATSEDFQLGKENAASAWASLEGSLGSVATDAALACEGASSPCGAGLPPPSACASACPAASHGRSNGAPGGSLESAEGDHAEPCFGSVSRSAGDQDRRLSVSSIRRNPRVGAVLSVVHDATESQEAWAVRAALEDEAIVPAGLRGELSGGASALSQLGTGRRVSATDAGPFAAALRAGLPGAAATRGASPVLGPSPGRPGSAATPEPAALATPVLAPSAALATPDPEPSAALATPDPELSAALATLDPEPSPALATPGPELTAALATPGRESPAALAMPDPELPAALASPGSPLPIALTTPGRVVPAALAMLDPAPSAAIATPGPAVPAAVVTPGPAPSAPLATPGRESPALADGLLCPSPSGEAAGADDDGAAREVPPERAAPAPAAAQAAAALAGRATWLDAPPNAGPTKRARLLLEPVAAAVEAVPESPPHGSQGAEEAAEVLGLLLGAPVMDGGIGRGSEHGDPGTLPAHATGKRGHRRRPEGSGRKTCPATFAAVPAASLSPLLPSTPCLAPEQAAALRALARSFHHRERRLLASLGAYVEGEG